MYGSTLSDSEIASSLLKVGEIYPDSSGGSDQITYTYNRQQQVLVVTDQGGAEHTYAYDALGRVTQDRATALGSGVDGTVRRIGRTYDAQGMVESVSSYDNPMIGSGSGLNALQFPKSDTAMVTEIYRGGGRLPLHSAGRDQETIVANDSKTRLEWLPKT